MSSGFLISLAKTFLEGMWAFILPCILPMLPVYLLYLSGDSIDGEVNIKKRLVNTIGFVMGFTILFMLLGAGASAIGNFLLRNKVWLSRIAGVMLVLFGLQFLGAFNKLIMRLQKKINDPQKKAGFLTKTLFKILTLQTNVDYTPKNTNFGSAILFGAAFSLGWSPCLGPFLGEALAKAGTSGSISEGMLLLLAFSLGLGVPFIIVSVVYEKITPLMNWIKKHYKYITVISGIVLILTGLAMMFDFLGYYMRIFQ